MLAFIHSMTDAERWAYGIFALAGITFFGHWLGQRLNHAFATARDHKQRRLAARAVFRAVVEKELGAMLSTFPTSSPEIDRRLKQAYPTLDSAVREFSRHVPLLQKQGFNRAWLVYCSSCGSDKEKNTYHHYLPSHEPGEKPPNVKEVFHKNVSRLLSFAKEP